MQISKYIYSCLPFVQVEKRSVGQQPPTAPATFKLVPVRTEQEMAPPPIAPSTAATSQKPSLDQIDRQVLHTVDDHAIQVCGPIGPMEALIYLRVKLVTNIQQWLEEVVIISKNRKKSINFVRNEPLLLDLKLVC